MGEWISEQPNYTLIITYPDDLLEESVVYQDIFQKGYEQGLQQAGANRFMVRRLEGWFGKLSRSMRQKLLQFEEAQMDALIDVVFTFQSKDDMTRWLKQQAVDGSNGC